MYREQFIDRQDYDALEIAAVWPASAQFAPFPVPELEQSSGRDDFQPTGAAPDVPAAIGGMIAASYGALIAALAVATTGPGKSILAIVIAAFFVAVFFAVPRIFFGVEQDNGPRARLDQFFTNGIETLTGHNSGRSALVQMLIVPVLLTLAVLAMGITVAAYR
jgi:hypothetical protein